MRRGWLPGPTTSATSPTTSTQSPRGRCPPTSLAARYTADRQADFDIYLPLWPAKHNKLIFGTLYFAGLAFAAVCWVRAAG